MPCYKEMMSDRTSVIVRGECVGCLCGRGMLVDDFEGVTELCTAIKKLLFLIELMRLLYLHDGMDKK